MPIAKVFGVLGLFTYIATLLPSILKIVFPSTKKSIIVRFLFKYRRQTGVTAFVFGLEHGILLIQENDLDLLCLDSYYNYFLGFLSLFILTLLAITSNNWSVKKLKQNWKRLHSLTYLIIFLLLGHVLLTMAGKWSYITHLEVCSITTIIILLLRRKFIETEGVKAKLEAKASSIKFMESALPTIKVNKSYITDIQIWSFLAILILYLQKKALKLKGITTTKLVNYKNYLTPVRNNFYITEFELWSKTAVIMLFLSIKWAELKGKPIATKAHTRKK